MGKLNMGILGGFSGTVGTVVGSTNKRGEDIIRVKSKKQRTTSSPGQINQRSKFSLVTGFLLPISNLLKIGFKGAAGNLMSPYNYACRAALIDAVTGTAPDYALDYGLLQISSGPLGLVLAPSAEQLQGKVTFRWVDNSANCRGASTDKVVLVVYNVTKGQASYSLDTCTRASQMGVVPLPYADVADILLYYLFLQSATDPQVVSDSMLLGTDAAV